MQTTLRDRAIGYIREKYHMEPIRPFFNLPGNAVFCHRTSRRWFAVFMMVMPEKLGISGKRAGTDFSLKPFTEENPRPQELVKILVLYCGPQDLEELLEEDGILPACHMSRKSWITVLLNGSVKEERIRQLIDESYEKTKMPQDANVQNRPDETGEKNRGIFEIGPAVKTAEKQFRPAGDSLWRRDGYARRKKPDAEGSVTFSSGYSDIPLSFSSGTLAETVPKKIMQMKALANKQNTAFLPSSGYIFYQQARFMESYEDNYSFNGRFEHYYPDYRAMTDHELRGYFTWRTLYRRYERKALEDALKKADLTASICNLFLQILQSQQKREQENPKRAEMVLDTELFRLSKSRSFLFVYLAELIHGIGAESAPEGLWKMLHLTWLFQNMYQELTEYAVLWSRDYAVYYKLPHDISNVFFDVGFDESLCALETEETGDEEFFEALCRVSLYDIKKSAFYRADPETMKQLQVRAVRCFQHEFSGMKKPDLIAQAYGLIHKNSHRMFAHSVFYDYRQYEKYAYPVSALCTFSCTAGQWTVEAPGSVSYAQKQKSRLIGDICREVDRIGREKTGFKHSLSSKTFNIYITETIGKVADEYLEEQREAEKPEFTIDMSRLKAIREDAAHTCDRLITEEEESIPGADLPSDIPGTAGIGLTLPERIEEAASQIETAAEAGEDRKELPEAGEDREEFTEAGNRTDTGTDVRLSREQRAFLILLLRKENWKAYLSERHLSVSILTDEINDAFMEEIGDTILEMEADIPVIIEDYREDIENLLGIQQ